MEPCSQCGIQVKVPPWKKKGYSGRKPATHFFCSMSCHRLWWKENVAPRFRGKGNKNWSGGKQSRTCIVCTKTFLVPQYRKEAKFCSHSCRAKFAFTGSRNPRWLGGVLREERDNNPLYTKWRNHVYKRDGWKCVLCAYRGRQLVAHHIRTWKHYPKLRHSVKNGITLCRACHCRLHTTHKKTIDLREILRDYMPNTER